MYDAAMTETPGLSRATAIALGLLALGGVALVLLVSARSGPGVSPDSVTYLAAARGLLDGDGYRASDGEPYVAFPPLFPTLIALLSSGVFDLTNVARLLNAVSFGVTIAATGWCVWRLSGASLFALLAAGAVLASRPVLNAALWLWSESFFTAQAMLCLACALQWLRRRSFVVWVSAVALAAAATLTRYIGVTLVLTIAVLPLLERPLRLRAMLKHIGVALLGIVPLALWLIRNLAVDGTLAGERYPSSQSLKDSIRGVLDTLGGWTLPPAVPASLRIESMALLTPLVMALGAWLVLSRAESAARARLHGYIPFAVFTLLYVLYLVAAETLTALDAIDVRLIAPLLPPAIVLIVVMLHEVAVHLSLRLGRWVLGAAAVAGVLWLALLGARSARLVQGLVADGVAGYEGQRWRTSELVGALSALNPDGVVYSNDPFIISYRTDRPARLSPRRHPYRSPHTPVDDLPQLEEALASGTEIYLVWFDDVPRDYLMSLAELEAALKLDPVVRARDGTVYRIGSTQ